MAKKKKSAKKATSKSAGKKRRARREYPMSLKKKVVSAIRKGMTHREASKSFDVLVYNIPNWLRKH